ncbi:enhanced intracellular survival protein Eis [Mycolicibacterium sp. S2-37]|uniref:enhanced intracellular survival protein Eis n=1 Tax=Mycolicibacterium sp. S2-37 TaxID=2810297 RepID=UPI001A9501F4|nr:enhanced intracellular survival protein Eis [Mycolicibacterium sp. S2-37]MBO0676094.1 enhanced intracellular survival protein Eis [Mycolicibacterium sp. S2-37]
MALSEPVHAESAVTLTPRSATDDDWSKMLRLDATSFGHVVDPASLAAWRSMIPAGGALVVEDGGDVVGQALYLDMEMTVPGGGRLPVAGISWVAVAPTHRRRGLLRAMLTELHDRIAVAGYPVAALTASEGGIYGRFGYGPATVQQGWSVDRRRVQFRPDAPDPGGVRIVAPAEHLEDFAERYDRWRANTPGGLARPRALWDDLMADRDGERGGGSPLFAFLHPDGYLLYRAHGEHAKYVRVVEKVAVTADADIALWRTLCGMDLMERIEIETHPGDPLPYLLTDARPVRTTASGDELWVRLNDIPTALQARSYGADLEVVLGVTDAFRGDVDRFVLRVEGGRAYCARTDAAAEVGLDVDVLGALYLGAHRASSFAAANRLRCNDSEIIGRLDAAFASEVSAELGFPF